MRGKVLGNRKLLYFISFLICFIIVQLVGVVVKADENEVNATYQTYTRESGWYNWASQGSDCIEGNTEALTGIKIMLTEKSNSEVKDNIKYSVYSSENGWGEEVSTKVKAISGETPIKAVKAQITNELANEYNLEYRVCTSSNQWTKWEKDGVVAGNTDGEEYIIAFQARTVKKENVNMSGEGQVQGTETPQENGETQVQIQGTETPQENGEAQVQIQGTETPQENGEAQVQIQGTEAPQQGEGSDVKEAFYNKVVSQLGQGRQADNTTVYGKWWANRVGDNAFADAKWCAMFLSWCASESGVAEKTVGYYAACSYWQDFYKSNGKWHDKEGYTPEKGDIIFFEGVGDSDGVANHNGLVESVSGTEVVTIEGNVNDKVDRCTYSLNDNLILGYGKPDYASNEANKVNDNSQNQGNNQNQENNQEQNDSQQNTQSASGQAQQLINVAKNEIGTREGANNHTKYGEWYAQKTGNRVFANSAWCAMFVSWCANQAGIPEDVIVPYALCSDGEAKFKAQNRWHSRSSGYIPKPGDIIFFNHHTGIVEFVADGYVHTIEGNTSNKVDRKSYPLTSTKVTSYGSPSYND